MHKSLLLVFLLVFTALMWAQTLTDEQNTTSTDTDTPKPDDTKIISTDENYPLLIDTIDSEPPPDPLKTFILPKNPTKAALLSTFIPGAGQVYNEKYLKAGIYVGIQATLVGVALHYDKQYKKYQGKISDKSDPFYDYNYVKYKDAYEYRQSFIFWVATSVFLSTLDAYVDAHLINFTEKKNQIHIKFEGDKVTLSVGF